MIIDRVTITGADDQVPLKWIRETSERYPFAEWGVLLSASSAGQPRYPSKGWIEDLLALKIPFSDKLHLSGHLCGRWTRDLLKGEFTFPYVDIWNAFDRIQLNFNAEKSEIQIEKFIALLNKLNKRFIFQWNGRNNELIELARSEGVNISALYDISGGKGVDPESWPHRINGIHCGYAGGLGPQNIVEKIREIDRAAGNGLVWIDMESKVRDASTNLMDPASVLFCLQAAEEFNTHTRTSIGTPQIKEGIKCPS